MFDEFCIHLSISTFTLTYQSKQLYLSIIDQ